MTEQLQTLDLELKELFVKQEYEQMLEFLNNTADEDVLEMTTQNWDVVKKYNDMGRTDLLRQHLTFVAYASFITEYAGKRSLFEEKIYQEKFSLFEDIFEKLQAENN